MSSAAKLRPSMRSIYSTSVVSPTNRLDTNCHDEKSSNYPEQKSKKLGLDGAECSIVDLSARGLSISQVERTLRVFETAFAMDLSQNEIEQFPMTIPTGIFALDLSFNMISLLVGVERLGMLQEINLSYNRIHDVRMLEACPRLLRVNLSGNRLSTTQGLETLEFLEVLDLSENLIDSPNAMRPLSLNQNLIHLSLRGNPISMKKDYRVLVMDLMPSVLILDEKKVRNSIKYKSLQEKKNNTIFHQKHTVMITAKSLSYSKLYDDKKQVIIQSHKSRKRSIQRDIKAQRNAVDAALNPDISTARIRLLKAALPPPLPPSVLLSPTSSSISPCANTTAYKCISEFEQSNSFGVVAAATNSGSYLSLYDRVARINSTSMTAVNPGTPGISHVSSPRNAPQVRPLPLRPKDIPNVSPPKPSPRLHAGAQRKLSFVTGDAALGIKNSRLPSLVADSHPIVSRQSSKVAVPDDKQANVLSVIHGLIAHKKQTLVNLANVNNSTIHTQNRGNNPSGTTEAFVRRRIMAGNFINSNSRVGPFTQPNVVMAMR